MAECADGEHAAVEQVGRWDSNRRCEVCGEVLYPEDGGLAPYVAPQAVNLPEDPPVEDPPTEEPQSEPEPEPEPASDPPPDPVPEEPAP